MGHKVNPVAFRLSLKGSSFGWQSHWFAKKGEYRKLVLEDLKIRNFLDEKLKVAGLVSTEIERLRGKVRITLRVSRPGMVIGRGGKGLEDLKKQLCQFLNIKEGADNLELEVEEVKNANLSAKLIAEKISWQIQKRMPYRRVIAKAMEEVMAAGAVGVKVIVSGRINGAEIGRTEKYSTGKVSLSSIRANVDYASVPSLTRSGYVGVKVYINRSEGED